MTLNDILSHIMIVAPNAEVFQQENGEICVSLGITIDDNDNAVPLVLER